jgi:sugar lactone lactonase YvrE
MSKATTAIVSLLIAGCISVLFHLAFAPLAAAGIVSALLLVLLLVLTKTAADSRPGMRWGQRLLRYAAPALLLLLVPALLWASFGTSFQGLVSTLPTPGLTLGDTQGVGLDSLGNLYIADRNNNRIVEVSAAGVASVVAFPGLSPALTMPMAVTVDGSGNLYVCEFGGSRVVELSPAGVTSVISTGTSDPLGLAVDVSGDLYIADGVSNNIVEVPAGGAAQNLVITGLSPALSVPTGVVLDVAGNLYIADLGNNRIVKVATPAGGTGAGTVLTFTGGITLNQPYGIGVDRLGNVYVSDYGNNRIVTITPAGAGAVLNLGSYTLNGPRGVAVSVWGAIYIADYSNARIVEAQPTTVGFGHLPVGAVSGTTLTLPVTIGFNVTFGSAQALTQGTPGLDFTVASTTCVAGVTSNAACTVNVTFLPTAAGLRKGALVIFNNAVPPVPILTVPLYATGDAPLASLTPGNASVVSTGSLALTAPSQIALDGEGNMYVTNFSSDDVVKVPAGGGQATVVSTSPIVLGSPYGVALDGAGNVYISDYQNGAVLKVTPAGVVTAFVTLANDGEPGPLAIDLAGNLYVVDFENNVVIKVTPAGVQSPVGTGNIAPDYIAWVAVDAAGTLYIDDQGNEQVIKVTAAGAASVVALPGLLGTAQDPNNYIDEPETVSVDGMGNLYIADDGFNPPIIWEVTAGGQTAAEYVTPPSAAALYFAQGVAVDGSGNLFIVDSVNGYIVEVNSAGSSQTFPNTFVGQSSTNLLGTTVTNIGNLPLTLASASPYTANFPEDTGEFDSGFLCGAGSALGTGEICDVHAYFNPQSVGALSANLLLTDNSLNGINVPQSIAVSGTGLSAGDSTATAVSTNPTSANLGQPITITATVTDTTTGHTATIPTGGVTFMDTVGSTSVSLNGGAAVTLNGAGAAILTGVTLSGAGTHTITANYAGVSGAFIASSNTTSIVVSALVSAVTLNVAPGSSVVAATAATLTATVTANGVPVTAGTVLFCNATAAQCSGEAVYGSAQLTSAGTAAIKLTLGAGTYSFLAEFQATNSTPAGASAPQPLTVTGAASYLSSTTIAESGVAGNYTLTGTVTAFGAVVPTGTVSFLDTTAGNGVVGTAALNPASLGFTFLPAVGSPVSAGQVPQGTVLGDFNHDGKLDLAVLNNGDQTISVLLGNGDGTFQPQVTYAVGHQSQGIAMGDFNGDGNLDLVVSNYVDDTISVLLGNGDGTFAPQVTYATAHRPQGIAVADFNGDGHLDLAVANTFGADVTILLGHGDGTFVADNPATFSVGSYPVAIATADLNGDGNADLVVTNSGDGSVSVLLGNGDGTFQSQIVLTIPGYPDLTPVAVGDFNGDGISDFVVGDSESNDVYVFLGINGLTFQAPVSYTTGNAAFGIVAADFQGTGHLDLAVTNAADNTVSLLLNRGDGSGTFQAQVTFPVGSTPLGIAAGDLNGDGLPDLAVANASYAAPFTASILLAAQTETAVATGQAVYGTGTHNVLASYPGDADRAASQSTTVPLAAIPQTATATTFTAAPNPAFAGQPVTLTATVAPAPTGAPLGTVSFYNGSALLGTATVNSSGVATFVGGLPVGVLSVTAVYSGNAGFAGSTSTPQTVTVNLNTTATTLTAAPNPASAGQLVTLTATVNPPPIFDLGLRGHTVPGPISLGTVSFYYGGTLLGSGSVNFSGVATSSTATLPVGADGLTAVYSGDSDFAGSTSSLYTETITAAAATSTTTVMTASPNPAIAGQPVTLTATVAPPPTGTPAGTVSFYNGTTLLGTIAVNSTGVAAFITSSLPVGALSITAVYSGNTAFASSTSTAVSEIVTAGTGVTATTTTLTASPSPLGDGQPVTLTATVSPAPSGTPNGTVAFYSGTTLLGTATLSSSGVATLTLSSLVVGTDSITAAYSGNSIFAASVSAAFSLTVTTSYTISAPATPFDVAQGGFVTVNITVPPLGGAFNNTVTLSASGLPGGATAAFNPPTVVPGTAGAPTVMTIQLASLSAGIPARPLPANRGGFPGASLSLAFVLFGTVLARKRIPRGLVLVIALAGLGITTSLLTSCNGGFQVVPHTQAGTYVVTITGTSGAIQSSATITLVVE